MDERKYLDALQREIKPALGCTEPIAVALVGVRAREALGRMPERIDLSVSRSILRNAMGVGIPGTGMVGLEIASALGCVAGHSCCGLEVLSGATPEDCEQARAMVGEAAFTCRPGKRTGSSSSRRGYPPGSMRRCASSRTPTRA
ncbi:MAG: hypothetical protein ACI4O7_04475 [Aristaeellaceae bacterium]